jgi:predicted MPP superfamily phosphohydrolase
MDMGKILVTHYKVRINDPENAPQKPFSVAVLSDMHNEVYRSGVAQLMEAIRNEQVSAVFSVGDLLVAKGERCACDVALDVLGRLTELYPVYAVNGNHEVRMRNVPQFREQFLEYDRRVRALGVTMVDNLRVPLRIGGSRIGLYGLEIDNGYYRRNLREGEREQPSKGRKPARKHFLTVQDMEKLVGKPEPGEYHILLAHFPRYFPTYAAWGADLTLSGHNHGGIIRLPGIGGLIGPDPGLLPKYDHGEFAIDGRKMIVSAGLGTHTIDLRINNPAELVILDFVGA